MLDAVRCSRSTVAFGSLCLVVAAVIGCGPGDSTEPRASGSAGGSTDAVAGPDACPSAAIAPARMPAGPLLAPSDADGAFPTFGLREIDGDPRRVLAGVDLLRQKRPEPVEPAEVSSGRISWRIDLPYKRLQGAERALVVPRVRAARGRPIELEPVVAEVQRAERGRFVEIELEAEPLRGLRGEGRLEAELHPVSSAARVETWSEPVGAEPGRAWLSYAIGVLAPGVASGPVRFRVEACASERCTCLHEEVLDPDDEPGRRWQERMLPLGSLADTPMRFRFTSELVEPGPDRAMLGVWQQPRVLAPAASPARHNVILISLDTLRADHLGAYGYGRETSPYMSGPLVAQATTFDHALAPATATAPSHMTLFTSLAPSVHGVTSNLSRAGLPEKVSTLAEVLRAHGFVTGSVNENAALTARLGFGRGFDYERQFRGEMMESPLGYVRAVLRAGQAFVDRHPDQRFFLFLHTYQVHDPYIPPRPYTKLFADGDDPAHPDNVRLGRWRYGGRPVLYDREIRYLDDELAAAMDGLRASGALDDTIVVITSDHGEAFAEHGFVGHGHDVFEESVRVPLFVMGPGIEAGRRIGEPVGLIDLMPTILDLVGVPVPSGVQGRSLAALLLGAEDVSALDGRVLVSESWRHRAVEDGEGVVRDIPALALRKGRYKLVRTTTTDGTFAFALFDVVADPSETEDLLGEGAPASAEAAAVAAELIPIARRHERAGQQLAEQLQLPPPDLEMIDFESESPERLEALRVLGYIE